MCGVGWHCILRTGLGGRATHELQVIINRLACRQTQCKAQGGLKKENDVQLFN